MKFQNIKITGEWEICNETNTEEEICPTCKMPIKDGRHKVKWIEKPIGIKFRLTDCPFHVGTIIGEDELPHEVLFIPHGQEEENKLKLLRIKYKARQEFELKYIQHKIK